MSEMEGPPTGGSDPLSDNNQSSATTEEAEGEGEQQEQPQTLPPSATSISPAAVAAASPAPGSPAPSSSTPAPELVPSATSAVAQANDEAAEEEAAQDKPPSPKGKSDKERSSVRLSQGSQGSTRYTWSENPRTGDVFYKRQAPIIRDPIAGPGPCFSVPSQIKAPSRAGHSIKPGPDRLWLYKDRAHYRQYKTSCSASAFPVNPAASVPMKPRPYYKSTLQGSKPTKSNKPEHCCEWEEKEERLKNYRDHLLAEKLGYETLVGNVLFIDIPKGRDLNRSWENFLSQDPMEWGFPYYKGSRDRPRVKQREPYLAHQLKERLWKYPKTKIFHAMPDD